MTSNIISEVSTNGEGSKVLYSSVQQFEHTGCATAVILNYVLTGTEHYSLENKTLPVRAKQYLIINQAQSFHVSIPYSQVPVTAFGVYLTEAFLADVARNYQLPEIDLLDNPFASATSKWEFFEGVYTQDSLQSILQKLEKYLNLAKSELQLPRQELYLQLAQELLLAHRYLTQKAFNLPAKRPAVKRELFKRVQAAKLLLDETPENLKISQLAAIVALSEFHFFRTFKQAFGQSPHLYQTQKRLEKAAGFLQQEAWSVSEIALAVGFEDIYSFSKAFKKYYHLSPLQYRQQFSRIG
ncbi:helix-turn-helix domain-containing protein [Adhaeribacter radiodurans]|uniref:Helix-turn-helix transcriptional regulator n=1 Tax=Adhaeribacter radiodurans TaxID=2745197 RepID=A0A7L7L7H4_9BACT|nr:AraC family transcriptional regulator [Adhaeribacter radiodurans]QMU28792.1 helix-turn-helix transcriptional regulator [Adhaeribacter radiodurans]